jgi:hypothetical protein
MFCGIKAYPGKSGIESFFKLLGSYGSSLSHKFQLEYQDKCISMFNPYCLMVVSRNSFPGLLDIEILHILSHVPGTVMFQDYDD